MAFRLASQSSRVKYSPSFIPSSISLVKGSSPWSIKLLGPTPNRISFSNFVKTVEPTVTFDESKAAIQSSSEATILFSRGIP